MRNFPAALAVALLVLAGWCSAEAAPLAPPRAGIAPDNAGSEQIHYRRHWRHHHRHYGWGHRHRHHYYQSYGYYPYAYSPGFSIYIGPRYRHRHRHWHY